MSPHPLEWIGMHEATAAGANERVEMDFNLDDDEVAEIWCIETAIQPAFPDPTVEARYTSALHVSTDPDVDTTNSAFAAVVQEDQETIHTQKQDTIIEAHDTVASIDMVYQGLFEKIMHFPMPVLVATNVAVMLGADAGIAVTFFAKIWFTRRKAKDNELVRTLLKRR